MLKTPQDIQKGFENRFDGSQYQCVALDCCCPKKAEIQSFYESVIKEILEEVVGEEKSLLADNAYNIGLPKKYVNFQMGRDLHYRSYNSKRAEILSKLQEGGWLEK